MIEKNDRYYTMWRGERKGPFDVTTLNEKIRTNEISLLHKVLVGGSWVSVKSFLESQRVAVPEDDPAPSPEPHWQEHAREEELEREIERLQGELRTQSHRVGNAPAPHYQEGPPPVYPYPNVSLPNQDQGSLVTAAWITLGVSFLLPPLAIVPFILGIILMAKSEVGHGIAVFLLSFVVPVMGGFFWIAFFDNI
jgi:hypothetical protein